MKSPNKLPDQLPTKLSTELPTKLSPLPELPPLPAPPDARGPYDVVLIHDNVAYVSGQVSRAPERVIAGHLTEHDDIGLACAAARVSMLRCLSALQHQLGSLDAIAQVLTVRGFISAAPDFKRHPEVLNAASQLLLDYLGERGRHARSAIGAASLPGGGLTEIEMTVALKPAGH